MAFPSAVADLLLKAGRGKSVLRRHPWIFSGAIQALRGDASPGETVTVRDASGKFLASAAYSPSSQIIARIWTWDESETLGVSFLERRILAALSSPYRQSLVSSLQSSVRLIHAESDGLPGLIVDRYADFLVLQSLTTGSEFWKGEIVDILIRHLSPRGIYERSDVAVREKEGLSPTEGTLAGDAPPAQVEIEEGGLKFRVDLKGGHKTGWYLDQRENRKTVAEFAEGRDVLDVFCYTGGFTAWALKGGAKSVVALDASGAALRLLRENVALNGVVGEQVETVEGDAFKVLREFRDAGRQFDLIVLDPPKFAQSASQVERAARAYKDINLLAFKLLRPGGVLFTFSCSGSVNADLFQKIVAGAALDAGVNAQIIRRLTQTPDHPVALNFPEGEYLKGLVCWKQYPESRPGRPLYFLPERRGAAPAPNRR